MDVAAFYAKDRPDRSTQMKGIGDLVVRAYAHDPLVIGIIVEVVIELDEREEGMEFVTYDIAWADGSSSRELDIEVDEAEWVINAIKGGDNNQ